MCEEAILLVKSGRKEKAMRWLGFIQGALWMHELAFVSIDDLKNLNKPDCPICKGLGFRNNDECDDCSCVKKQ